MKYSLWDSSCVGLPVITSPVYQLKHGYFDLLFYFIYFEMGSHYVAQAGLKFLGSRDPPASTFLIISRKSLFQNEPPNNNILSLSLFFFFFGTGV
jgi:hypothetical protein